MVQSSYIAKRLGFAAVSVIGVTVILFFLLQVLPGDPVLMNVPIGTSQQQVDAMRQALGLDQPLPVQYVIWLRNMLVGNLGTSFQYGLPVTQMLTSHLPATLELAFSSLFFSLFFGIGITILPFFKRSRWLDAILSGLTFSFTAIPEFVWGILLIVFFGATLKVLPVTGRVTPGLQPTTITGFYTIDSLLTGNLTAFESATAHLVLPVLAISLPLIALIYRTLSSSLRTVMAQDYIVMERSKGLSEQYIIVARALRNAIIPMISILGVSFAFVFGGSIVIEYVFNWGGLGSLAFAAVTYRDFPMIKGLVLLYAIIVVVLNLAIDMLYSVINPRIRY